MTKRDAQQLERIIDTMTVAEKRELVNRLIDSLDDGRCRSVSADRMTPEEKNQILESVERIANLPIEGPDDGFSGKDHDEVLYGRDSHKTNLPQ